MEFTEFQKIQTIHIKNMFKRTENLFLADVDPDELWELYLDSFPPGTNELFRERREFDCQCCKSFIRKFGAVVVIKGKKMETAWDFSSKGSKFEPVCKALSKRINESAIKQIFFSDKREIGTEKSFEVNDDGVIGWDHFYVELPFKFVKQKKEIGKLVGQANVYRNLLERAIKEIPGEIVADVLDMIAEGVIYRGKEWKAPLSMLLELKAEFRQISDDKEKDNWLWKTSNETAPNVVMIKNRSIGVLLDDLTKGMDATKAIKKYSTNVVAPENYQRPKSVYTRRQVEMAEKYVMEHGLMKSLPRRFAVPDDIDGENLLWMNKDNKELSVFGQLKQESAVNPAKFDRVQAVTIDKFISDVLPGLNKLEVLMENRHIANLVSLTTQENSDAPSLFKWQNPFGWTYSNNLADSAIKAKVKELGGDIEVDFRASIAWNHDGGDNNDLDIHCYEPNGFHIHYANMRSCTTDGWLDVDIREPLRQVNDGLAVENIRYKDRSKMSVGLYRFSCHCFAYRGGQSGFSAEIEFDGVIHSFKRERPMKQGESVEIATVRYNREGGFEIVQSMPNSGRELKTNEVWNLKTNQFHPVNLITLSPNYWGYNRGNKHFFFFLNGCINDEEPRGFFNEFLLEGHRENRKVFEALGNKMKVAQSENQLSGLGFSETKSDALIVRGNNKIMKIVFN